MVIHTLYVIVKVIDDGIGIEKVKRDKLFKLNSDAQDYQQSTQGIGLGLSVCERFIASVGGTIDVKSEPGDGSEFYFKLPIGIVT